MWFPSARPFAFYIPLAPNLLTSVSRPRRVHSLSELLWGFDLQSGQPSLQFFSCHQHPQGEFSLILCHTKGLTSWARGCGKTGKISVPFSQGSSPTSSEYPYKAPLSFPRHLSLSVVSPCSRRMNAGAMHLFMMSSTFLSCTPLLAVQNYFWGYADRRGVCSSIDHFGGGGRTMNQKKAFRLGVHPS